MAIGKEEEVLRSVSKSPLQQLRTIKVVKSFLVFLITYTACTRGDLWKAYSKVGKIFEMLKRLLRYNLYPQKVL